MNGTLCASKVPCPDAPSGRNCRQRDCPRCRTPNGPTFATRTLVEEVRAALKRRTTDQTLRAWAAASHTHARGPDAETGQYRGEPHGTVCVGCEVTRNLREPWRQPGALKAPADMTLAERKRELARQAKRLKGYADGVALSRIQKEG